MTSVRSDSTSAPSYRTATGVALGILALYLVTLAPTIGLWDSGEYVAAAAGLGIPHPPGNPGFLMLGRVASLLPMARTVAARLNVLVALASALSAGLWFLVAEHIVRHWLTASRARVAAAACAVLGATAFTVWNQSVVNEKVYTISLFLLALDIWTAMRWQASPDGPAADRRLMLICYRLGLGYTVHIAGLLAGPAVLAATLYTRPRTLYRTRFMLACGALFLLGMTPFITLPIRSGFRLDINEGHPSACEDGRPHWGCTLSRETADRFFYEHNRTQYAKPSILERQQTLPNQVGMWWLYFKWQWLRDVKLKAPEVQSAVAILMLLLAGAGGYAHWRYDRRSFVPFATLVATLTVGLITYLNFKLGYTQAVTMHVALAARETRDRDYFYLWSFSALAIWIGLGLAFVWKLVAEFSGGGILAEDDPWAGWLTHRWPLASLVFTVALIPVIANWTAASRRADTFAEDFAIDLLNSVEPNAILFTGGDNDSFPLWFAQQVLGIRRDVSVVLTPYLSTDWYARELIARMPEPYDVARGPALYRNGVAAYTPQPVLDLTRTQADAIPGQTRTFATKSVRMSGFDLAIPPTTLDRDALVMLRIIQAAGSARPVYFSSGAGSQVMDVFFKPHLLTQGLARKVVPEAVAVPGMVVTRHVGALDVARTQLLWDHLRARASMGARGVWTDEASANLPYLYLRLGVALADAQDSTGNHAGARQLREEVLRMGRALDFARYLQRGPVLEAPTGLGYAPVVGR